MHEHGNLFSYPQFNSTQITDPVVTGGSITKSTEINGGSLEDVLLANTVKCHGFPNVHGAKIPVQSDWKLDAFEKLLGNYHDKEIIDYLRYGWPANRLPGIKNPTINKVNHASATQHPDFVDKFIDKEVKVGVLMGPFEEIPFTGDRVGVSPLSTRPKKGSETDRHTIVDLSYPEGSSMNDGISKDNYMGFGISLKFPMVDSLAKRMHELKHDCWFFKRDLSSAFYQIPLDPADYELFGIYWKGLYDWYKKLVMGHQIAPYICQQIPMQYVTFTQSCNYFC